GRVFQPPAPRSSRHPPSHCEPISPPLRARKLLAERQPARLKRRPSEPDFGAGLDARQECVTGYLKTDCLLKSAMRASATLGPFWLIFQTQYRAQAMTLVVAFVSRRDKANASGERALGRLHLRPASEVALLRRQASIRRSCWPAPSSRSPASASHDSAARTCCGCW